MKAHERVAEAQRLRAERLQLEIYLCVDDVMAQLGCKREAAYKHMRAALGRRTGARGLLRVPKSAWERYVAPELHQKRTCKPSAPRATSAVYFVQHDAAGPIKIGRAADIALRVRLLQGGNPYPLHLRGYVKAENLETEERRLHQKFAAHRIGGEWFRPAVELLEFIERSTTRWT